MRGARKTMAVTAAATVAAGLLLAGCSSSSDAASSDSAATSGASTSMASPSADGSMAAQAGSEADITFAQLMIPHHEQAVQMADMALNQATTAEVKQLAQQIKDAQDPEIQQMRGWLQAWGAPEQMAGMDGMDHGDMDMGGQSADGMMSDEDMTSLMDAQGADFDKMWLEMMIAHHAGAITMAENIKQESQDADVTNLANSIISAQQAEIATMQALLAK